MMKGCSTASKILRSVMICLTLLSPFILSFLNVFIA